MTDDNGNEPIDVGDVDDFVTEEDTAKRNINQMNDDIEALANLVHLHMQTVDERGISQVTEIDVQLHHFVITFIGLMGGFSHYAQQNGERLAKRTEEIMPALDAEINPDLGGFVADQ